MAGRGWPLPWPCTSAPDRGSTAPDHSAAAEAPAIAVIEDRPNEGGNLARVEATELGEFRDQGQGGDRANARHGREEVLGFAPDWAGADGVVQVGVHVLQGLLEPGYVGIEPALQGPGASQPAAVRFGTEHLDELAPAGDELAEVLQLSIRARGARLGGWPRQSVQ